MQQVSALLQYPPLRRSCPHAPSYLEQPPPTRCDLSCSSEPGVGQMVSRWDVHHTTQANEPRAPTCKRRRASDHSLNRAPSNAYIIAATCHESRTHLRVLADPHNRRTTSYDCAASSTARTWAVAAAPRASISTSPCAKPQSKTAYLPQVVCTRATHSTNRGLKHGERLCHSVQVLATVAGGVHDGDDRPLSQRRQLSVDSLHICWGQRVAAQGKFPGTRSRRRRTACDEVPSPPRTPPWIHARGSH